MSAVTSVDPARLRAKRLAAGFRKEEVAVALGVAFGTVSAWEAGSITPSAPRLLALAQLYEVGVEELCS